MRLTFVETTQFTRTVAAAGWEEDVRLLQLELLQNPEKGPMEVGTGGLRKVRMRLRGSGKGKSSGARVHYVYVRDRELIYLLFVYAKAEQSVLSEQQKKILRPLIERFKSER